MAQEQFIRQIDLTAWDQPLPGVDHTALTQALENGQVVYFPRLRFELLQEEQQFLTPEISGKSKNVSYDSGTGNLSGVAEGLHGSPQLRDMLARYARYAQGLLLQHFAQYAGALRPGRTSFRPVEIAGRAASWKKDDTRLHVDSFPATPLHGERIMRVFSNVNPHGEGRAWRIGGGFESTAQRFMPRLRPPLPGSAALLKAIGATKSRRSAYDHYMLQLHDAMKGSAEFQANSVQLDYEFPAGCTWMCFTDQVPHAAMSGQFVLEQTFYLPVNAMADPDKSPLRILERLSGRKLALKNHLQI